MFAQQGYFVIAPNPTGSTSFGQEFTDAITEDWGGRPFVDMQKGWKYALEQYPEVLRLHYQSLPYLLCNSDRPRPRGSSRRQLGRLCHQVRPPLPVSLLMFDVLIILDP